MKRKNFITAALLAIPTLSFANKLWFKQKEIDVARGDKKGFVLK